MQLSAAVQLQVFHEELEPECLGQVHLHQFPLKVQDRSHHFMTPDACSCRRHSAFLFGHGKPRRHSLL